MVRYCDALLQALLDSLDGCLCNYVNLSEHTQSSILGMIITISYIMWALARGKGRQLPGDIWGSELTPYGLMALPVCYEIASLNASCYICPSQHLTIDERNGTTPLKLNQNFSLTLKKSKAKPLWIVYDFFYSSFGYGSKSHLYMSIDRKTMSCGK